MVRGRVRVRTLLGRIIMIGKDRVEGIKLATTIRTLRVHIPVASI